MGKTHLYIAMSLDGFIATEDGGIDWLDAFHDVDYGFAAFERTTDAMVMGRVTYEQVRTFGAWPHPGKPCIVLSHTPLEGEHPGGVVFRDTLPTNLHGTTWLVGGRQVIHSYLAAGQLDTLELFVMPTFLGTGIPLFTGGTRPCNATLREHTIYPNGVARLLYDLNQR